MELNKCFELDLTNGKIEELQGFVSHKSAPKGYPKDKSKYADEKRFKYPVDTESRVRAAWSYINMPKNQKGYSSEELKTIKEKIKSAGKKFGIEFND